MASKRHKRNKICGHHKRYEKREYAVKARGAIREEGMNIWMCKYCGGWHVGHRPGWVARALRDGQWPYGRER